MRRLLPVLSLVAALLAAPAAASARPHNLLTGFTDDAVFLRAPLADRQAGFSHARAARGSVVRVFISWADVAPSRPAEQERRARSRLGRLPLGHPGPRRSRGERGSVAPARHLGWGAGLGRGGEAALECAAGQLATLGFRVPRLRPGRRPPLLGQLRRAASDPLLAGLERAQPERVSSTPSGDRRRGRLVPASPGWYRKLLNGFYAGIKAGRRGDVVVTAGTAPFGDHRRGARRMDPAYFVRNLFCLRGRRRPRPIRRCGPVRFDALAHHPYPIGPPTRTTAAPDDVVVPDIWKLTRPLRVALRSGKVRPRRHKQIWATEISWDTAPPDPDGIPIRRQARYLEGAFYTLWRQGVDVVAWFLMRDDPRGRGYGFTLQSGVYFRGPTVAQDRPKPFSFQAFRFPFTAYRRRGVAQLWGLAPHAGTVTIELRRGGRWRRAFRVRTRSGRLFFSPRRVPKGSVLRARQGSETSLPWRVSANATERRR